MTLPLPLRFRGAPGSPYSRKMLALLRYRHLPYEFLVADNAENRALPTPKVQLLPTFFLPNSAGELEAVVDSTPLIRRFEAEFAERRAVPEQPALAYLDYLIEDYADEWLTKAMFHYRWYYQDDIDKAGSILPLWREPSMPPDVHAERARWIADRQIGRLYVVGSNDTTAPVIEDSYRRFLAVFDRLLQRQPFVMGQRPGASDFGIYAQLTQLAKFDPTPAAICLAEAPRVHAWTDLVDDLSGWPAEASAWLAVDQAGEVLGDLLAEIGRVYTPALLANAEALMAGRETMETTIDGRPWVQPAFPYQGKCLQWLRQGFAALGAADQAAVRGIVAGSGCEPLLEQPS
ncbi:MAG: glutathione S-transferase N-terminal domain-containing protein [Pseudomonadales bacterium]